MRRSLVIFVIAAIGLAGCSSGDDEASPPAPTAPTTTTTPEQATAKALLLSIDDLPDGWVGPTGLNQEQSEGIKDSLAALPECLGLAPVDKTTELLTFQNQQEVLVAVGEVYPDAKRLQDEVAAMKRPEALACMKTQATDAAKQELGRLGAQNIEPTVEATTVPGLDLDDNSYALRTTALTNVNGRQIQLVTDVIFAARDRQLAGASLAYFNELPPLEVEKQVLGTLKNKVLQN